MRILLIIYCLLGILFSKTIFAQQSHGQQFYANLLQNNKVTIHTEDHQKMIFHVEDLKIKASSTKDYYWYASNKIQKTQGGYGGKLLHGNYQKYFENNVLNESGKYKKGLKIGEWKEWNGNGNLKKQSHWHKGVETGKYKLYDANGFKLEDGFLKQGLKDGKAMIFQHNDSTYVAHFYAMGKSISQEEYIQANFFRRTGQFLKTKWNKLFSKKKEEQATP